MHIVLKIVLFIGACILGPYIFGVAMMGEEAITNRHGAAFAFFLGVVWAYVYWPVTLMAVPLAFWGIFLWRRGS